MNQLQVLQALRPSGDYCVSGVLTKETIGTAIKYVTKVENGLAIFGIPSNPVTWEQFTSKKQSMEQEEIDNKLLNDNRLSSAKSKLDGLGFTVDEIKTAFGI